MTTGIIAEYNPFHNGHKWQLDEAKRRSGNPVVVIMSGPFTQRGEPALLCKTARARMALCNGASAVIELPVFFAVGGAELFARGAVSLASALGLGCLCFGAECDNLEALRQAAGILAHEPSSYKYALKNFLSEGTGFAVSREKALAEVLNGDSLSCLSALFRGPNNILALEYLSAIEKFAPSIIPIAVKREGAGHDSLVPKGAFASASYLRDRANAGRLCELRPYMPENAFDILAGEITDISRARLPKSIDKYSSILHYILKSEKFKPNIEIYKNNRENESLWGHIAKIAAGNWHISAIVDNAASKRHTKSRVRRMIMRRVLGLPPEGVKRPAFPLYARVLGFRREDEDIISSIAENSSIPIITNLKHAEKILKGNEAALEMLKMDLFAQEIFNMDIQDARNEFSVPMVIL